MPALGVIGSGVMGAGIAQVAATNGWTVTLLDVSPEVVNRAIGGIHQQLDRLIQKGKLSPDERELVIGRLRAAAGPAQLIESDLIIEAVAEKLDVKVQALGAVKAAGCNAIFASNTSSLSIAEIGNGIQAPDRTIGLHFFNPVPLMPLVEVITPSAGDPAVADQAAAWVASWRKTVVRAKDTPGFIVNRVARGYYLEALRLLDEGVMPIEAIDETMRKLGGFRMGPFELMDLVGIDVNFTVSTSVWEQMGKPARLKPHAIQESLFRSGKFGRKSGAGFYSYAGERPQPAVAHALRALAITDSLRALAIDFAQQGAAVPAGSEESFVFARILGAIINEAYLALDDGVATAADINTAMRLGTNYPRGPLEWADKIGVERCQALLNELNQSAPDRRYAPAKSLRQGKRTQ